MCWDKLPGVIGCFRSFNIRHPLPGRVDQSPACVPAPLAHGFALLIYSHLVVFSAASVAVLMAFLFASPVMASSIKAVQSESPANPRQPRLWWNLSIHLLSGTDNIDCQVIHESSFWGLLQSSPSQRASVFYLS